MSHWFVDRGVDLFPLTHLWPKATINKKIIRNSIKAILSTTEAKAILMKTKKHVSLFAFDESKVTSHQVLEVLKYFYYVCDFVLSSVHDRQLQEKKIMPLNARIIFILDNTVN